MKKAIVLSIFCFVSFTSFAQRYAVVDLQYILNKLPEYANADTTLQLMQMKWQKEVDSSKHYADSLSNRFDAEKYMLADELKSKRQIEVDNAEKRVMYLQTKYFGYKGELFQQREKLVQPIQNKIYSVIQQMALKNGWDLVFYKNADTGLLYSDPKLDKSDAVLEALGVKTK
ncbi:hypothetical protein A9P82_15055 [Arachidicoccus ginsenosidimutans]|uniref:OmpH family outer membrane protein n=1 Tax=Arachidicoccus sp. BS20 TaxID=1850526 RepID=UPI0007F0CE55|nr:OmpH family outer membrane protein [Arachidicoccus sp. BS20]ANI90490.1 hypothetical protein A9P82_15055 [Arachidicoccus sp. BS20]